MTEYIKTKPDKVKLNCGNESDRCQVNENKRLFLPLGAVTKGWRHGQEKT